MHRPVLGGASAPVVNFVGASALLGGLTVLTLLAAPTIAAAQCAEGRVASEQTAGRCCWPGQTWNADASLCSGAPACPAGRVGQGDDCVVAAGGGAASAEVAPPPAQAAAPVAPTGYGAQPTPQGQPQGYYQEQGYAPAPEPEMRTVMAINKGLVISGAIIFGASYLPAVFFAVGEAYGYLAIPLAGPFILMGEVNGSDAAAGYAYMGLTVWGLAQVVGATLFVLGMTLKREVQIQADLGNGRSIALAPWDVPGGGGLQLLGEF